MADRSTLGRAVAALFAGRLVVNTAQRFVYPFLPAIARGLGISLQQAGLLVSARWIAGLPTPAVVAVAGRREQRRRLAFTGLLLFAIGAAVTALTGVFAGALVGFTLMGLGKPAYDISTLSYVADRTPYRRRARYLSLLELTWAGGLLVGAPAAGWAIDRLGWKSPFWLLSLLALSVIALLALVLQPDRPAAAAPPPRLRLTTTGMALLTATGLFSFAAEVMFVVFGAWLEDAFGLSLVALGGAAFVVGLSELAGEGATIALTDRLGKRRAVSIGLVLSIAGFGLLGLEPSILWVGMALIALALFGFEFTIVSAIPLATEVAPTARARYLALFIVGMSLGRAAGAALGPVLFEDLGLAGNALVAAGVDLVALALLLGWVRERSLAHPPADGPLPESPAQRPRGSRES